MKMNFKKPSKGSVNYLISKQSLDGSEKIIKQMEKEIDPDFLEEMRSCFMEFQEKLWEIHLRYFETYRFVNNTGDIVSDELVEEWEKNFSKFFILFMKNPHPFFMDYEKVLQD